MKDFHDSDGRPWTIEINVAALKRIKGLTGVDLMEVLDGSLIERLIADPVLLCDVVYAACKPEADSRGVTDEQFGAAMAGDAIDQATQALLDEIVSFCPSPRDRANLGRILQKTNEAMDKARDLVERHLEDGVLDEAIDKELAKAADWRSRPGHQSGDAPASPASIPGR